MERPLVALCVGELRIDSKYEHLGSYTWLKNCMFVFYFVVQLPLSFLFFFFLGVKYVLLVKLLSEQNCKVFLIFFSKVSFFSDIKNKKKGIANNSYLNSSFKSPVLKKLNLFR